MLLTGSESQFRLWLSTLRKPGPLPRKPVLESATELVSQDLLWAWGQQRVGRRSLLILCVILRVNQKSTPNQFNDNPGGLATILCPFSCFFPFISGNFFFTLTNVASVPSDPFGFGQHLP